MAKNANGAGKTMLRGARWFFTALISFFLAIAVCFSAACESCDNKPTDIVDGGNDTDNRVEDDNPSTNLKDTVIGPVDSVNGEKFENDFTATTAVGYSSKILGTAERVKPVAEVRNEGLTAYPKYGSTLNEVIGSSEDKVAARNALINESDYLSASGTRNNSGNGSNGEGTYSWMDKDGYLYSGTTANPVQAVNPDGSKRQLYKHTAANGMYLGGFGGSDDLLDSEEGIVKQVTIRPRGYSSYSVTGVYAPAGEVIKIEISEKDMNATGGLTVHIGQALYNGQSNNIWAAKGQMQRFPNILNTMNVNKNTATLKDGVYTAYVGSFIGGPLYIRNTSAEFTATISGGVRYSHFILGSTTKEEYEENMKSSAPYFDLEVWNYGVLHSGPKYYAKNFSYEDIYKAAVLWEKVSSVTTTGSSQGIVFIYDPFVAAGAAVAFPGRSSVNCPTGWMSSSLNYNSMVTSGAWGNFHEYHHNFQGYGVGNGGEVTNNGMTLVSYALFTKISAKRGIGSYGGQGLGGWNNYTSASWALNELLSIQRGGSPSNGKQGLSIYATLLHNFGANNYIQAKVKQRSGHYGENYQGYLRAWQDITHNDMTYFFKDVLQGIDGAVEDKWHNPDYPTFVPVSSVYQTGRSYMYDGQKKYFNTMQPYVIPFGEDFTIDLNKYDAPNGQYSGGSVVIPDGFDYKIKSITKPKKGTIENIDNYKFKYTPDKNSLSSGQIIVTLEITKKDGAFKVDDVDLILEFEQSHETNKMTLERTTYTYSAETMYTDAKTAYENGFKNYTSVVEKANHSNPVQNCNTDIWFYPDNEKTRAEHPDAPESHFVHPNTIEVIDGKLYFEEEGKYRVYLRGRTNCAVYYSVDGGKTYKLGASVKNGSGSGFYPNNSETYFDLELAEHSWVYVKEVLIVQDKPVISYIGLGYGKWTTPMFTMVEKFYDKNGNEVASADAEGYSYTKTHYYDYRGVEVSEEEATNAALIAPTGATYVNAYRSDYEFPDNNGFESDYFYVRNYTYSYSENYKNLNQSFVTDPQCPSNFPKENLFDGKLNTACSSPNLVSANAPWQFTVDLGETIKANRFVLTGRLNQDNVAKNQTPNSLTLYVGDTPDNLRELKTVEEAELINNITLQLDFETTTFRYYKLVVRSTPEKRYAAIGDIAFSNVIAEGLENGILFNADNSAFTYGGDWSIKSANATFGHVYVGAANAEMAFRFKGERFAILSSDDFGTDFEVTIDGKKATSLQLKAITGSYGASFMSELLEGEEHTVVIKCKSQANIDSIVIYKK